MKSFHFTLLEVFTLLSLSERKDIYDKLELLDNIVRLLQILNLVREFLNAPITITSCYRNAEHNKRVGGSATSQHLTASAIDFKVRGFGKIEYKSTAEWLVKNFTLGQVIAYDTFIHISLPRDNKPNQQFINKQS